MTVSTIRHANGLVSKGIVTMAKLVKSIRPAPLYALTGISIMGAAIAVIKGNSVREVLDAVAGPTSLIGIAIVMLGIYRMRASVDYKATGNISPEAFLFLSLGIILTMGSVVGKIIIFDVPEGSVHMAGWAVL